MSNPSVSDQASDPQDTRACRNVTALSADPSLSSAPGGVVGLPVTSAAPGALGVSVTASHVEVHAPMMRSVPLYTNSFCLYQPLLH